MEPSKIYVNVWATITIFEMFRQYQETLFSIKQQKLNNIGSQIESMKILFPTYSFLKKINLCTIYYLKGWACKVLPTCIWGLIIIGSIFWVFTVGQAQS